MSHTFSCLWPRRKPYSYYIRFTRRLSLGETPILLSKNRLSKASEDLGIRIFYLNKYFSEMAPQEERIEFHWHWFDGIQFAFPEKLFFPFTPDYKELFEL